MKKFNFKTLLICLLVLVLAIGLVACNGGTGSNKNKDKNPNKKPPSSNNNGDDDTPKQLGNIAAEEFFNTLWDKASAIGNEKIGAEDDIKLSVDLSIEAGTKDLMKSTDATSLESLSLGVGLDFVLDRHNTAIAADDVVSPAANHSAVKIALSFGGKNLASLYFFLKDADYLYIDFDDVHIKVNAKVNKVNEQIGDLIKKYVFNAKITQPEKVQGADGKEKNNPFYSLNGKTANDIINIFAENMGSTWTLNTLIGNVTSLFNLNLKDLITGNSMINNLLPNILGVDSADVFFDEQGNLKVADVLGNATLGEFFKCDKTNVTGGNHYTNRIAPDLFDLIGTFVGKSDIGKAMLGTNGLINSNSEVGFDYDVLNGNIANFAIVAYLKNINLGESKDASGNKVTASYPYIAVHINHFNFRKATAESENLGINTADYKEDVTVALTEKLSFTGITVDASKLDDGTNFTAEVKDIEVGLKATVNINNNDKTNANMWISYGGKHIVDASYIGQKDTLAVKFDKTVKFSDSAETSALELIIKYAGKSVVEALDKQFVGASIADVAKELFGTNYDAVQKDGAMWTNLDLQRVLKKFVFDKYVGESFNLTTWLEQMISSGKPASEDTVASAADVMLNGFNITKFLKSLFAVGQFEGAKITANSNDVMETVAEFGKLFVADKASEWTKEQLIANIKAKIKGAFQKNEEGFNTWIVKIAQAIKIGENSFTKNDATEALDYLVDTVFESLSANVVIDFTHGMEMSVTANFGGASIKLEHSLRAYVSEGNTYQDFAPAEDGRTNWFVHNNAESWYGEAA